MKVKESSLRNASGLTAVFTWRQENKMQTDVMTVSPL